MNTYQFYQQVYQLCIIFEKYISTEVIRSTKTFCRYVACRYFREIEWAFWFCRSCHYCQWGPNTLRSRVFFHTITVSVSHILYFFGFNCYIRLQGHDDVKGFKKFIQLKKYDRTHAFKIQDLKKIVKTYQQHCSSNNSISSYAVVDIVNYKFQIIII